MVDGDTVVFLAELGFGASLKVGTRLARINAPESNRRASKVEGKAATTHLTNLLKNQDIFIKTFKPKRSYKEKSGKYGRWIVEIFVKTEDGYLNINDQMVTDGHAKYQEY